MTETRACSTVLDTFLYFLKFLNGFNAFLKFSATRWKGVCSMLGVVGKSIC